MEPNQGAQLPTPPAPADPPPAPGQPVNVDIKREITREQIRRLRDPLPVRIFNLVAPMIVIGGIGAFVYYSLVLYKPTDGLACGNEIQKQADIAVHVVRQWAGKEGQEYAGCTR
jgi:hypothetical protein